MGKHIFVDLESDSGRGSGLVREIARLTRTHPRKLGTFSAALVVAAAAFWAVMLTTPPVAEAVSADMGVNVFEMMRNAAKDLPVSEYDTH